MKKRAVICFVVMLILFTSAACTASYKTVENNSNVIEPQPVDTESKTVLMKLFFPARYGGLIMEFRKVQDSNDVIKNVLNEYLKGPSQPYEYQGAPLGTELIYYEIKQKTIYVNLTSNFLNASDKQVVALINTLTTLSNIDNVQILIEGQKERDMGLSPVGKQVLVGKKRYDPVYVKVLQMNIKKGVETWRTDPINVLRVEGGAEGFSENDSFKVVSNSTSEVDIDASHNGGGYLVRLTNQFQKNETPVWLVTDVEAKFTDIPEQNPSIGETYVYGKLINKDSSKMIIEISKDYQDSQNTSISVGPYINVLPDAIIHFQEKIGYNENGYQYEEKDIKFNDIAIGSNLGIILNKDRKARAIIVSDQKQLDIEPNIKVTAPKENEVLSSPFKVIGIARVFEGTVNLKLSTIDGKILDQTTAQASLNAPSWGDYEALISYQPLVMPTYAILQVYTISPKDGSENDIISVPVKLK